MRYIIPGRSEESISFPFIPFIYQYLCGNLQNALGNLNKRHDILVVETCVYACLSIRAGTIFRYGVTSGFFKLKSTGVPNPARSVEVGCHNSTRCTVAFFLSARTFVRATFSNPPVSFYIPTGLYSRTNSNFFPPELIELWINIRMILVIFLMFHVKPSRLLIIICKFCV